MKQQLVSIQKHSACCGFDLCPKKYKYLANPTLLDKVFSNQVPRFEKIVDVKRPRYLDEEDTMHTTECVMCKESFLLPVENPVCTSCRRIY
ncbi:hypothetical protein NsoK4_08160 [Nitrosopumilus sp. K4]|uniref:hypothetical protein n=1 Tax=Nitrosopumilus sp. K4 TaxID=2795383 RepID=UPI001BAB92F7|nr:hypothetical protein [Nitrosopumilus sp. K4]QUC64389.1 hypothetical protein NsoK4_08160 [Nitrosopumilus sp. K4]